MVRRVAVLMLLIACNGGLLTERGNDFPCDFTQPEGVRDAVCAPGEVCGVDNRCRQYRYEGPQFELGAREPDFSAPQLKHPMVMTEPLTLVTRAVTDNRLNAIAVTAGAERKAYRLHVDNGLQLDSVTLPQQAADLTSAAIANGPNPFVVALVRRNDEDVTFRFDDLMLGGPQELAPRFGDRLRAGTGRIALVRRADAGFGAFDVTAMGAPNPLDFLVPDAGSDGGFGVVRSLDVRFLPKLPEDDVVGVASDGLYFHRDRRFDERISGDEPMPQSLSLSGARVDLRHDTTGTVFAFSVSVGGNALVLSSWRLERTQSPSAVRLWNDCSPCQGRIAAFAPTSELGSPAVEVLCEQPGEGLSLVRVSGSSAASELQRCIVEQIEAPFALSQVNLVTRGRRLAEEEPPFVVFDEGFGAGVAVGGQRGQLWMGTSFSRALPFFLERTPLAFGAVPARDGGSVPAVLTDRYLAVARDVTRGYEVIDIRNVGAALAEGVVGAAFIGQARGWGLLTSGDVVLLDPENPLDGGRTLTFGPRLLDARGAPARAPFFGEAATAADGSLVSFVLTADDSVYFLPAPAPGTTTASASVLPSVSPQLTPLPASPIRSFVLERSALGTDGVNRVRAYLVAGRSLFVVTLDGTPPRWSATPLVLQGGEPLEVWMDHPLGGLGRAGYRDGQVFSLPGGFLLVNALPLDAGTRPPQVLDYENLGGWPVAMTSNGLFEAHYAVVDGGYLENRFEDGGVNRAMSWARVALPDGGEPWLGKNARLEVTIERRAYDAATDGVFFGAPPGTVRVFRLLVYTDEQVLEVGRLTRR